MGSQRAAGECVLGIDLGTSNAKAVIVSLDGAVVAEATRPIPMLTPEPGAAEQDPAAWWAATVGAVRAALGDDAMRRRVISAIGVAGQMHGTVLVDRQGEPTRAAITWADTRATDALATIERTLGRERVVAITGSAPALGLTAPSLLWLREVDPHAWGRAAMVLLPKDLLRWWLTGEHATDPSDASGTLLYDVSSRRWSEELLAALGLPETLLPPLRESAEVAGTLCRGAAEELGLPVGLPVVTGAGDTPAAALAVGVIAPGTGASAAAGSVGSISLGTAGQVVVATGRPLIDGRGRVQALVHALPGTWYLMAAILTAGSALAWLATLLRPSMALADAIAELDTLAGTVPAGARGVLFAPYLRGERSPHGDPAVRGAFTGLESSHGAAELARAVMEGVAFALHDGQRVMDELGAPLDRIVLSGGGARSATWSRIVAGVFGVPVERRPEAGGSAVGAALLAGIGTGRMSPLDRARQLTGIGPDSPTAVRATRDEVDRYAESGARFRALYPRLAGDMGHAHAASATENRFPQ